MERKLYGFLINDGILFNISKRTVLLYNDDSSENSVFLNVVSLNEIQARLLQFLMTHSTKTFVDKNDIMKEVWDEFGLASSNQRLWQTINELRRKLFFMGLPDDFIVNIHGLGYFIDGKNISSLFME